MRGGTRAHVQGRPCRAGAPSDLGLRTKVQVELSGEGRVLGVQASTTASHRGRGNPSAQEMAMTRLIRILIAATMGALIVAFPGQAIARGHHGHHQRGRHHGRHHRSRVRVRDMHAASGPVATVASFANGKLTIQLTDGSTVSGQVTGRTEIECPPPPPPASTTPAPSSTRDHGPRDGDTASTTSSSKSSSDDGAKPAETPEPAEAPEPAEPPENEAMENEAAEKPDADQAEAEKCGPDALKPGTPVREARLRIGPDGSTFDKVELGS